MSLVTSLSRIGIIELIKRQISNLFQDKNTEEITKCVNLALDRFEYCASKIKKKYYQEDNNILFDHLNSDHYSMFLYFCSNSEYQLHGDSCLAKKLFYLNKIMHSIDVFYSVKLPNIFLFVHPLGSVLGNAKYSDYFVVYQNCTIGSGFNGIYPTFEKEVVLYSKSSVIGDVKIGQNSIIGANTSILNTHIPPNSVVVGNYPKHKINKNKYRVIKDIFNNTEEQ